MMSAILKVAAVAAIAMHAAGCIYAPIDLGLGDLGRPDETLLVPARTDAKVLLVRIDGEITDEAESRGFFGSSEGTTAQVKDVLDRARGDDDVVALILRINSPGGGVTASDIVYREILQWKKDTGKPVVALFMDTAASGGYYIAQAADRIVAHPTCITGSIGVITMLPNVSKLAGMVGVEVTTIKSGPNKDMGNMFRAPSDDDRKLFQSLIDQMYGRFVDVVAAGRKAVLTKDKVQKLADGRVYTAMEARDNKLIDEIGYFDDALAAAKSLAKVKLARVVSFERKGLGSGGRRTIYSSAPEQPVAAEVFAAARAGGGDTSLIKIDAGRSAPLTGPALKYLWLPAIH